jgi:3-hydroxybutyryl-CoA dehydrogenase
MMNALAKIDLFDIKEEFVVRGVATIQTNLCRSVDKGKLVGDVRDSILSGIVATASFDALVNVDYVVEAAIVRKNQTGWLG